MTDVQVVLAIISANALITSLIMGMFGLTINNRISDLRESLNTRFDDQNRFLELKFNVLDARMGNVEQRIKALEQRKSA